MSAEGNRTARPWNPNTHYFDIIFDDIPRGSHHSSVNRKGLLTVQLHAACLAWSMLIACAPQPNTAREGAAADSTPTRAEPRLQERSSRADFPAHWWAP